jgi:hypothetical protein
MNTNTKLLFPGYKLPQIWRRQGSRVCEKICYTEKIFEIDRENRGFRGKRPSFKILATPDFRLTIVYFSFENESKETPFDPVAWLLSHSDISDTLLASVSMSLVGLRPGNLQPVKFTTVF